jgi:hypothetical protein
MIATGGRDGVLGNHLREDLFVDPSDPEGGGMREGWREGGKEGELTDLLAYCLATASGENFNICSCPLRPNSSPRVLPGRDNQARKGEGGGRGYRLE